MNTKLTNTTMKTMLELYKEIFENKEWKYYSNHSCLYLPLKDEKRAIEFIQQYFLNGGKRNALDPFKLENNDRNIHTLSTFFLGIYLKEIDPEYKQIRPNFIYLWYLTCLYHDYGYCIEGDKDTFCPSKYSLKSLKQKLEIKHDILANPVIAEFSSKLVRQYFKYCKMELNILNHGIIGGLLLYDRLNKNFDTIKEQAKKEALENNKTFDPKNFIYNHLHWSSDHDKWYKKVAGIIIAHNIWYCTDIKDKDLYLDYGLDELILIQNKSDKRLKCQDNKLIFLLCLSDTIEPTKHFSQIEPLCLLEKIQIEYNSTKKELKISVLDSCLNYKSWFRKIIDIKKWLSVSITSRSNILTIKILE